MKYKKITIFICLIITLISSNVKALSSFTWSEDLIETSTIEKSKENENKTSLNLESGAGILVEQNTGKILYSYNEHEKLRPASVTKIMTILLIMESIDKGELKLADKIPCSENAASMGGSQIWLDPREELSVDEMLKAICVVSANDCTVAMAEYIGGTEESFVELMNKRAKELGMNDTTFKNCHGIDEEGHVTSAYDISLMARELLTKHPSITKYTTIWMDSLRDGKSELVNTNKLIRNYKGATGLKTGSTSAALYNLAASATRDDLSLIAVIMRAPTTKIRFSEAQKLLDYGFANYTYKKFGNSGDIVKNVIVEKGISNSLNAIYENDVSVLIKKGQEKNVIQNIYINEKIIAPIKEGEKIGEVTLKLNEEEIAKINIIAEREIKQNGLWNILASVYEKWFKILR